MEHSRRTAVALVLLVILAGAALAEDAAVYRSEIEEYRRGREERLRRPDGYLSLVGLFWLEAGANGLGSDPSNAVVFPEGTAAAHVGALHYDGEQVRLEAPADAGITLEERPVSEAPLAPDDPGPPDVLKLGRLSFYIIARGDRHGVRVKDPESPYRQGFHGIDYFPIDPDLRVEGLLKRFDEPREIAVPTVLGTPASMLAPGTVELSLGGRRLRLLPLVGKPDDRDLWFILRDGTSGKESYGGGRFLWAELEDDGTVVIDFNRLYNPPCAFTPHATCPLPPRDNWLDARIEGGEKLYEKH